MLRTLLWVILFLFGVTGLIVPGLYLWTASKLPDLDSAYEVETLARLAVEGERMSRALGLDPKLRTWVKFEKPDLGKYPKDFVALYLSQMGCPDYFKTAKEEGMPWAKRLARATYGGALDGDAAGACEYMFSERLAGLLNVKGTLEVIVAASKIHAALGKDELVAYDLETAYIARGLIGVRQAVVQTLGKDVKEMTLAELAEAALVVPPNNLYDEIRNCTNASLIKRARDSVLDELAKDNLVTQSQATAAEGQPVLCLKTVP